MSLVAPCPPVSHRRALCLFPVRHRIRASQPWARSTLSRQRRTERTKNLNLNTNNNRKNNSDQRRSSRQLRIDPGAGLSLVPPFDREMRCKGYHVLRYPGDCLITCKFAAEARAAIFAAHRVLERLGMKLHRQKVRVVHVEPGVIEANSGTSLALPKSSFRAVIPSRKTRLRFRSAENGA